MDRVDDRLLAAAAERVAGSWSRALRAQFPDRRFTVDSDDSIVTAFQA